MKKTHLRLAISLTVYSLFLGFVGPSLAKDVVFDHNYAGFTIQVPNTWIVEYPPGKEKNAPAVYVTTPDGGSKDEFLENCNVCIGKEAENVDGAKLRLVHKRGQNGLKQMTRDFTEYKKEETQVGGLPAIWSITAFTAPGAQAQTKNLGYMIAHNQMVFSVICTALPTTFSGYEQTFHDIAKSFRVTQK